MFSISVYGIWEWLIEIDELLYNRYQFKLQRSSINGSYIVVVRMKEKVSKSKNLDYSR